ncbi:prephenate dehydrogenase/arogenate dehydrogenase family protein [Nitrosomonas sp.]|uniref:prephenate dehydrogenase n=1 Tax=Nitrosomonas sp. TaxID=42353 RepID=UPI0025F57582|nr:prephenate dehydrogenase/arogenate dehydrogenase family protein [Nitrosomonas sp.]MCC6916973.1 prephenate dehydrogenase/arogenate dehydrogenase family protein [Nitrosomonas sp.]
MVSSALSKLVIIGVGLIGGSFALALRRTGLVGRVVGIGRSPENMQRALELGIIDEQTDNFSAALSGADFVLLAIPVKQTASVMQQMAPCLEDHTIVSDAGSTKQNVIQAARSNLGKHIERFIPAHPIAGTEFSGAEAAFPELFQNKPVILTPLQENNQQAIDRVTALWQHCGANVSLMQAEQHDQILAAISHLPHMLAFSLMRHIHTLSQTLDQGLVPTPGGGGPMAVLQLAGTSLNDMTRIAASSPEMWRDICLENRAALLAQIEAYQQELSALQQMLANHDGESLQKLFSAARATRQEWTAFRNKS